MATTKTKVGAIGALVAAATLTMALFLTSSNEINVPVGGNLQQAINDAPCGATLVLEAGQAYPFNGTLPKKDCADQWITIQSSRTSELPEGVRVSPATQAPLFAKLQSTVNAEPVVRTLPAAHHYKFIGIQFETRDTGVFVYDLVRFGEGRDSQKTRDVVPHHLVLDRSFVAGRANQDTQRGVSLNCADCEVTNSWISDIRGRGMDTQAICGWNGTERVRIINNTLLATGENVMFGGADSAATAWDANGKPIDGLVPTSIEIRRNYFAKPPEWKGQGYTIKNLLELKAAKNVVIDGNMFENLWGNEGQSGVPIVITVRNQDCTAPWSTIQNVTYTNNILRNTDGGFNFLGKDNEAEPTYFENGKPKCGDPGETFGSVQGAGFFASNNLAYGIRGPFITLNGFDDVSFNRDTVVQGSNLTTIYGRPSRRFKLTNNLFFDHIYGIYIEAGSGVPGLNILTPEWMIEQNVVVGATDKPNWPPNNQHVDSLTLPPDFRSPFAAAGADIDALNAAQTGGVVTIPWPTPTPSPSPSPTATATASPSPTSTPLQVSANNTRVPPATELIAADGAVWTLDGNIMLRNGADTGGRGPELLWCSQAIYALGVNNGWWKWIDGTTNWVPVAGDPCAVAGTPSPTPTATSTPTPSPTPTSTPTPSPQPSPSPSTTPTRICARGERPGVPPRCVCRNNAPVRPNGKCP